MPGPVNSNAARDRTRIQLCDVRRRVCLRKPVSINLDRFQGLLTRYSPRRPDGRLDLIASATYTMRTPLIGSNVYRLLTKLNKAKGTKGTVQFQPATIKLLTKHWNNKHVIARQRRIHQMITVLNVLSVNPSANRALLEAATQRLEAYSATLIRYIDYAKRMPGIKRLLKREEVPGWSKASQIVMTSNPDLWPWQKMLDNVGKDELLDGPNGALMIGDSDAAAVLESRFRMIDNLPRLTMSIKKLHEKMPEGIRHAKQMAARLKKQREEAAHREAALKRLSKMKGIVDTLRRAHITTDPRERAKLRQRALKQLEAHMRAMKPYELRNLGLMSNATSRHGLVLMYNAYLNRVTGTALKQAGGYHPVWIRDKQAVLWRQRALQSGNSYAALRIRRPAPRVGLMSIFKTRLFPLQSRMAHWQRMQAGTVRLHTRMLGMMRSVVASARYHDRDLPLLNARGLRLSRFGKQRRIRSSGLHVVHPSSLGWRGRRGANFLISPGGARGVHVGQGLSVIRMNGQWFASSDPLQGFDPNAGSLVRPQNASVQNETTLRWQRVEIIATALYEQDRAVVTDWMMDAARQIGNRNPAEKQRMEKVIQKLKTLPPRQLISYMVTVKPRIETGLMMVKIDQQQAELKDLMTNGYNTLMFSSKVDKAAGNRAVAALDRAKAKLMEVRTVYLRYEGRKMPENVRLALVQKAKELQKIIKTSQKHVHKMLEPVRKAAKRTGFIIKIGILVVAIAASILTGLAATPALATVLGSGLALKAGVLVVSAAAFTAVETIGNAAFFDQKVTPWGVIEDFAVNVAMFALFGWLMKSIGAGLGKLTGKELATKIGQKLLQGSGKQVTADLALKTGQEWLAKAGLLQQQLVKYGYLKGAGSRALLESMGKWAAEYGAEIASFKLWETAQLLRQAVGLSTRPIDGKTLRRELAHSTATAAGWGETAAMVAGLKAYGAALNSGASKLMQPYLKRLMVRYELDKGLLSVQRLTETARAEVARSQARRMRILEAFGVEVPAADRTMVDSYNVSDVYTRNCTVDRLLAEARLTLSIEDAAAFKQALKHAESQDVLSHHEIGYLRKSLALHQIAQLRGGQGLHGPRLWTTNRILAKAGGYTIEGGMIKKLPPKLGTWARTRRALANVLHGAFGKYKIVRLPFILSMFIVVPNEKVTKVEKPRANERAGAKKQSDAKEAGKNLPRIDLNQPFPKRVEQALNKTRGLIKEQTTSIDWKASLKQQAYRSPVTSKTTTLIAYDGKVEALRKLLTGSANGPLPPSYEIISFTQYRKRTRLNYILHKACARDKNSFSNDQAEKIAYFAERVELYLSGRLKDKPLPPDSIARLNVVKDLVAFRDGNNPSPSTPPTSTPNKPNQSEGPTLASITVNGRGPALPKQNSRVVRRQKFDNRVRDLYVRDAKIRRLAKQGRTSEKPLTVKVDHRRPPILRVNRQALLMGNKHSYSTRTIVARSSSNARRIRKILTGSETGKLPRGYEIITERQYRVRQQIDKMLFNTLYDPTSGVQQIKYSPQVARTIARYADAIERYGRGDGPLPKPPKRIAHGTTVIAKLTKLRNTFFKSRLDAVLRNKNALGISTTHRLDRYNYLTKPKSEDPYKSLTVTIIAKDEASASKLRRDLTGSENGSLPPRYEILSKSQYEAISKIDLAIANGAYEIGKPIHSRHLKTVLKHARELVSYLLGRRKTRPGFVNGPKYLKPILERFSNLANGRRAMPPAAIRGRRPAPPPIPADARVQRGDNRVVIKHSLPRPALTPTPPGEIIPAGSAKGAAKRIFAGVRKAIDAVNKNPSLKTILLLGASLISAALTGVPVVLGLFVAVGNRRIMIRRKGQTSGPYITEGDELKIGGGGNRGVTFIDVDSGKLNLICTSGKIRIDTRDGRSKNLNADDLYTLSEGDTIYVNNREYVVGKTETIDPASTPAGAPARGDHRVAGTQPRQWNPRIHEYPSQIIVVNTARNQSHIITERRIKNQSGSSELFFARDNNGMWSVWCTRGFAQIQKNGQWIDFAAGQKIGIRDGDTIQFGGETVQVRFPVN